MHFLTSRGRTALQIRSDESSGWFATRHRKLSLDEPSIPHQIITNRVCDWMKAKAMPEQLLPKEVWAKTKHKSRPDAVYEPRNGKEAGVA